MGSVKDLNIIKEPTAAEMGEGVFSFSDRYSVFDWGEMPDHIFGKGAALAMMAAFNFEQFEKKGITTHYRGMIDKDGNCRHLDELTSPSSGMAVRLVRVLKPSPIYGLNDKNEIVIEKYNYDLFLNYAGKLNNFLIPLEIVYRNGAPKGSSLFDKISEAKEKGNTKYIKDLLEKTGLEEEPTPGVLFLRPVYDFATKLESTGDRQLTDDGAYRISGLHWKMFDAMVERRNYARNLIKQRCEEAGFVDYDGKFEFAYFHEPLLVDVAGTFDENRFMLNGEQVSKEFLRQWYKKNQPEWIEAIRKAKDSKSGNWKGVCEVKPMSLPTELRTLVGQMYMSGANRYIGKKWFDSPPLEEVMEKIRPHM